MRRADGDQARGLVGAVAALVGGARAQPRARDQSAHAVRDDHRRQPGGGLDAAHGALDLRDVVVQAREQRLQAHRDERAIELEQPLHPWIPQPAVADVAVDEDDAPQSARGLGQMILDGVRTPGHAPAEDGGRFAPLAQYRAQHVEPAGTRRAVAGSHAAGQQHLDGQHRRMAQHQKVERDPAGERPAGRACGLQQAGEQGEPGDEQQASDAGEHSPSITQRRRPCWEMPSLRTTHGRSFDG